MGRHRKVWDWERRLEDCWLALWVYGVCALVSVPVLLPIFV